MSASSIWSHKYDFRPKLHSNQFNYLLIISILKPRRNRQYKYRQAITTFSFQKWKQMTMKPTNSSHDYISTVPMNKKMHLKKLSCKSQNNYLFKVKSLEFSKNSSFSYRRLFHFVIRIEHIGLSTLLLWIRNLLLLYMVLRSGVDIEGTVSEILPMSSWIQKTRNLKWLSCCLIVSKPKRIVWEILEILAGIQCDCCL